MSTIEEAAVSRLLADATVAAIATGGHHAEIAPQGTVAPHTVYQVISAPELRKNCYVTPRLQVACWAKSYPVKVALANAVRACFYDQHLTVAGVHFCSDVINTMDGDRDPDTGWTCRIVDVRFYYRNPI